MRLRIHVAQGLKNITCKEGEGVVFEVIIKCYPEPIVKWYREEVIISSSPDYEITWENSVARLTIAEIFPEDAGVFRCTATNADGTESTEARLIVQSSSPVSIQEMPAAEVPMYQTFAPKREAAAPAAIKPEIVDKPVNCRLVEGTNAVFESRVTGVPFPEVTWQKRGFPIRREASRSEGTTDLQPMNFESRLMHEIHLRDGRVKFTSETETSEYDSEVLDSDHAPAQPQAPQIVQKLKNFGLIEGSDATFVCRITGLPRPKIAWYKNGHRIKRSSRYEMKYKKDGYYTLRIRIALPEDAGHFTILAVNSQGKDTCSSELFVDSVGNIDATSFVAPETLDRILDRDIETKSRPEDEGGILEALSRPQFKKVPENLQVREGHTVRFDTVVSGRPVPELQWFCNDKPVHNDLNHKMVVNEDGVNSLIILSVSRYDDGIYTCLATNKAGDNKFSVTLTLLEKEQVQPPKFVKRMQNFTVKEGQPVSLTCEVNGVPAPMISWQKEGKMLVPSQPYRIITEGCRSTLNIDVTKPTDTAWFQCSAVNVAGTASTRSKLVIQVEEKRQEIKPLKITKQKVTPPRTAPKPAPFKKEPAKQVRMPGSQSPP